MDNIFMNSENSKTSNSPTLLPNLSEKIKLKRSYKSSDCNLECGFTLKRVCDMTRTYSQMHRTDKHSEHSSIIWQIRPNG